MIPFSNFDEAEIAKFSAHASHWWDPEGDLKTLHQINPLRVNYINEKASVAGKKIIDIGCGAGLLTEALAKLGADVTGIDMSKEAITIAKLHQHESKLNIDYRVVTAEKMAEDHAGQFDIVTCLEMLEHVPDPLSAINACSTLVKPGGQVFFSTLNRNLKSYLQAIIGAEYILKILPKHTHEYAKFIKPSELASWARKANLSVKDMIGIHYDVFSKEFDLRSDVSVNYLMWLRKSIT